MESELYGEFAFRDTILDQLDRYWVYLQRMRLHDPDAYGMYSQLGAAVVPPAAWSLQDGPHHLDENRSKPPPQPLKLSPWWKVHRPTFGCIVYGITPLVEKYESEHQDMWVPKFMYFNKYNKPPPNIQPTSGGDVYGMTIWWDKPHVKKMTRSNKGGVPEEYAVFISKDGTDVHALPMCKVEMVPIPEKWNGLVHFNIPQKAWRIPKQFIAWAKFNNMEPDQFLTDIFIDAANHVEQANYSMTRIAVSKGNMTAVFGVDPRRMAYFFQDRDVTLTVNGSRQRVFHMVRAHVRKTGKAVKFHFRGLREFEWAGYHVKITVPGRDHFMLPEIDIGCDDSYWLDKKDKDNMTQPQLGKLLNKMMAAGRGGHK